ncbi:hypothetical protein BHE74_00039993 [Ensete ventricosum]|nr:hypothetical protein BHE74_00039993 [Ensete ventricosum]RZS24643.1 hypothetical protein BHM03_00057729 [Ensete ventricosum]
MEGVASPARARRSTGHTAGASRLVAALCGNRCRSCESDTCTSPPHANFELVFSAFRGCRSFWWSSMDIMCGERKRTNTTFFPHSFLLAYMPTVISLSRFAAGRPWQSHSLPCVLFPKPKIPRLLPAAFLTATTVLRQFRC